MYQTGGTIKATLDALAGRELVLPAIQREFVWSPEQICRLFDSLLQGYPIGTFLYWKVKPEFAHNFTYYNFVLDYHEQKSPYGERFQLTSGKGLTAVLDGQQRLTSLNIGFRGTMAWKLPNKWRRNASAYPVRRLYLDVLWEPSDGDDERQYRFDFLTDERVKVPAHGECWFPVYRVLSMDSGPEMHAWLNKRLDQAEIESAYQKAWRLHQIAHSEKVVAFYEEGSQELDRVLQIFIRMNSGGTVLSYSDLLLSVAVAQWTKLDAREEIRTLVRELNEIGNGFSFSKDLVLKAGLMLSDIGSVGFKVDNFNKKNMAILEESWERVRSSLTISVELLADFGFSGHTLRADSAVLPIAYYIHTRGHDERYLRKNEHRDDRRAIQHWLTCSILKASGVWGSGLDTLLTALREVIKASKGGFPVKKCREEMARRGRPLAFEEEEIKDLASVRYDDPRVFALLALLFPFVDLKQHAFHIDHVVPRARFTRAALRRAQMSEEEAGDLIECRDRLANLQLLEGAENSAKRDKMPAVWLREKTDEERRNYVDLHVLGDVPEEMAEFLPFFKSRRKKLRRRIRKKLLDR